MKELEDMSLEELWELFPIILKEHNPDYALWYDGERQHLLNTLKEFHVTRISHIGSTAVSGLIAKPIIDILLELPGNYTMDSIICRLKAAGWILMNREDALKTLDFNKGYTVNGFAEKVYHLHVRTSGDWDELYFRDYLIEHAEAARSYEELKIKLKSRYEHNRDAYTDAKNEFVMKYTKEARAEFGKRYMPDNLP